MGHRRCGVFEARQLFLVYICCSVVFSPAQVSATRHLRAQTLAQPDYTVYHHKDVLLKEVESLVAAHPEVMKLEMRHGEDKGYAVDLQVVTVELGGLTSGNYSDKARIFMDFGEHGREYISAELGIRLLRTLINPAEIKAVLGGGERGDKLYEMLKNVVFVILPLENTRGRDLVESGRLCERKNGRGVDPNRNWEVDWGKKEKDYDPNEENPGPGPFSEPEVRIVLDIAKTLKPHAWVNVHSGMEAMFVPWDHVATVYGYCVESACTQVPEGAQEALRVLQTIHKDFFTQDCVVGSGGKSVGYLAHGTATDYMYERLKVPLPYTWEIYGDMKADFNDCFRMFNPLTKQHVDSVTGLWMKAIMRLVELLPTHPRIAAEVSFTPKQQPSQQQQKPSQQQPQTSQEGGPAPKAAAGSPGSSQSHSPGPGKGSGAEAPPAGQQPGSDPGSQQKGGGQHQHHTGGQLLPPGAHVEEVVYQRPIPGSNGAATGGGSSQLVINLGLAAVGVLVVGVLVYRYVGSSTSAEPGDPGDGSAGGAAGGWGSSQTKGMESAGSWSTPPAGSYGSALSNGSNAGMSSSTKHHMVAATMGRIPFGKLPV